MRLVRVERSEWRQSRRRATRFMVVFFSLIALAWPVVNIEFGDTDAPVMDNVTYEKYHLTLTVNKDGSEDAEETVVIDFGTPSAYVRSVGELASNDPHVRYFSEPVSATIDGEEVDIEWGRGGVGGRYYSMGEDLVGRHTIEFKYRVKQSIIDQDGRPTFRARLLARSSLAQVKDFRATVIMEPGMITEDALCWLTNDTKPLREQDKCEFETLTPNEAVVDIENPGYLRPVRFTVPVQDGEYPSTRLPWSGYWDSTLGRHTYTPFLCLIAGAAIVFGLRRFTSRVETIKILLIIAGAWVASLLVFIFAFHAGPSVIFIIFAALLWLMVEPYLRLTESRLIVGGEELEKLKEKADAQAREKVAKEKKKV